MRPKLTKICPHGVTFQNVIIIKLTIQKRVVRVVKIVIFKGILED